MKQILRNISISKNRKEFDPQKFITNNFNIVAFDKIFKLYNLNNYIIKDFIFNDGTNYSHKKACNIFNNKNSIFFCKTLHEIGL